MTDDPQTLKEAIDSKEAPKQKEAIRAEYTKLQDTRTWKLVDRPKGIKILSGKLVFKTKRDQNSQIEKYKARQVVRGYEQ